jgi:putative sterol carrier protein
VIFVAQAGRNQHEHICESIELFAAEVMPRFAERAARWEQQKRERMAPAIERALARRDPPRTAPPGYTIWPDHEPWHQRPDDGHVRKPVARAAFNWFVRGRSDAQLDAIFGSLAGQTLIFRAMERAYAPANALAGALQYELTGRSGTRTWVVRVDAKRLRAQPGVDPHPNAILRMPAATFARMAAGQQTAASAAMNGELHMEGDLRLVSRVAEALAQLPV